MRQMSLAFVLLLVLVPELVMAQVDIRRISLTDKRIALPPDPPAAVQLQKTISSPEQLEDMTARAGVPAALLNYNFAVPMDLSAIGMGRGIYIPVMISADHRGRKSLLFLQKSERTLAGVFASESGLALKYVTRETGTTFPAQTGDVFREEWTNREGTSLFTARGPFEFSDPARGKGRLKLEGTYRSIRVDAKCKVDCSVILWSLVCGCKVECTVVTTTIE